MSTVELQPTQNEPSDSQETPALLVSVAVHLLMLVLFGVVTVPGARQSGVLTLLSTSADKPDELPVVLENLQVREIDDQVAGADSVSDSQAAVSVAPVVADVASVPPPDLALMEYGETSVAPVLSDPVGLEKSPIRLRGSGGNAVTGAAGAIDRLTHEIVLSLEQRPTLVAWLFDQSGSLTGQRQEIRRRMDRIYEELGQIRSSGSSAFQRPVEPLLSSVIAFGAGVQLLTKKPTSNVSQLQSAIATISDDDSGIENTFGAIRFAVSKFKRMRQRTAAQPARNIMLIIFSDEVGDDQQLLESCVHECRRFEIPVYVVGVPSPFGRAETLVKWVDPHPDFDQTPRWGRVNQGPESLRPELIRLRFADDDRSLDTIDSGFGPFALTRLCVETGGIYFTVHPNRRTRRPVSRGEIAAYASHLRVFFSAEVMRRYRPDYVSADEYQRRLNANPHRAALVAAARESWLSPMENPRRQFVFRDEGQFSRDLSEAQKNAAQLIPRIDRLYETLRQGEQNRLQENTARWQAGYDLAMGRVLAIKVRTESYNVMLAQAKGGLTPRNPRNNTWILRPSRELVIGSRLHVLADRAGEYLRRVGQEHPQTPWAVLAEKELAHSLSWQWHDKFTELRPTVQQVANNSNRPRRQDDQKRMLNRPKPSRPIPRL